jgi:hypothetical protein
VATTSTVALQREKKVHVLGKPINGVRVSPCTNPNRALQEELRTKLREQEQVEREEKQKQAVASNGINGASVVALMRKDQDLVNAANQAVLEFIATNDSSGPANEPVSDEDAAPD